MSKYIHLQSQKLLSAYGGAGSILETPKGALMVEEFDKWLFHKSGACNIPQYEIEENRLIGRLKFHFPRLQKLVKVPINQENYQYKVLPLKPKEVASARYFPEWMYCPTCERFKPIRLWWIRWKQTLEKHKFNKDKIAEQFIKPKCYHCYDQQREGKKRGWVNYELEQVPFIMTAPSGDIRDVPWNFWTNLEKNVKEEDAEGGNIKFHGPCCDNQDLRYLRSDMYADLAGVRIKCMNSTCPSKGKEVTLAGLFGMRIGKEKESQFKPVVRTSNSVYYPLCINSIYLPQKKEEVAEGDKALINNYLQANQDRTILYTMFAHKYARETIDNFIDEAAISGFESENAFRLKEYQYILEHPNYHEPENNNLSYTNEDARSLAVYGIESLIKVKRLKLTTVQTAYTRQEPLDKDLFISAVEETSLKVKYTSTEGINTPYLLAAESFGEGIFFAFQKEALDSWYVEQRAKSEAFKERLELVQNRIAGSRFIPKNKFSDERHLAKFLLFHTLSHLLIKELEFLCGYSATCLNERLYIDSAQMQGILLYTVGGAEGSYGGLTSQAAPQNFKKILDSALHRATDCSSDPVCYHSEGQGIAGTNLAACYSCALLPETSCEELNSFLDRALLVDKAYGFFHHNATSSDTIDGQPAPQPHVAIP